MKALTTVVCPYCGDKVYLAASKRNSTEKYCKCLRCYWYGRVKDAKQNTL